ncbi:MAG: hypothetical protein WCW31_05670 [Patescibacteria group bacterium]|jgi:hypothetical protein
MRLLNKTISLAANAMRRCGYDFNEQADCRVQDMKKEIRQLGGSIEFKIEQYPDGSWAAESTNVDGIITGGESTKKISFTIKDAIFTYFGIPPQLCTDNLLRADNEPVTVKQQVYV